MKKFIIALLVAASSLAAIAKESPTPQNIADNPPNLTLNFLATLTCFEQGKNDGLICTTITNDNTYQIYIIPQELVVDYLKKEKALNHQR